ncbi:OLC1v1011622C2 [Oldenlandia corymbosa var. corymbosa]|nr:OLC1v1011622C2 [Oldenlandia corymbosa var. corymbosa]
MNFVSNPLPLMSGALLILVIASWGCLVFARIADRRLRCSLEDLKKRESTFLENVNEFAVLIQKSQKVCQSKVAPVSQQDLPVNSGDGPPDMSWLIKLETLECRFELLRSHTPDSGILKGNRVEGIIRFLAVSFVLLGFCMMIVIYRNQDSTDL